MTEPAGPTAIRDGGILIEKDVPIPLADGHIAYCNVFRPEGFTVPAIVVFTPYGKDSDVAVDFKRYWDLVLRDHPEVVQSGSSGKNLYKSEAPAWRSRGFYSGPLCWGAGGGPRMGRSPGRDGKT